MSILRHVWTSARAPWCFGVDDLLHILFIYWYNYFDISASWFNVSVRKMTGAAQVPARFSAHYGSKVVNSAHS